jgi:3-methyladenine DNA glycosylase AlkD
MALTMTKQNANIKISMNKGRLLKDIKKELKDNIDPKYAESVKRFYKKGEWTGTIGVRTPIVRKISAKYFRQVKGWSKKDIFDFCEVLLKTKTSSTIAFDWVYQMRDQYKIGDFKLFESWLKKYVDSWSKCDELCGGPLGHLIFSYPQLIKKTKNWTTSKNRWLRRASAVTMIISVRNKKGLKKAFKIADILLLDEDDLVQKGYGWMLKEVSNIYQKEVFNFVLKRKDKMPRTALRYAIEKMPDNLRKKAMEK